MKGNRAALAAVVVIVLIAAGWWLFSRGGGAEPVDLVAEFQGAEKRPADGTFEVTEIELAGETHTAIYTVPESRIIWRVTVPEDAWLRVLVGIKQEAWTTEGDGVLFRVGVSDGRTYEPLFEQHVNPFANAAERKWIPVMVDLSPYADEQVEIIFNTNRSLPNRPLDGRGDLALWGHPQIITR